MLAAAISFFRRTQALGRRSWRFKAFRRTGLALLATGFVWTVYLGALYYFDLTVCPERIRTSLEDFKPWSHYPTIEVFYTLLERLNHKSSALESNDCAFEGPRRNENRAVAKALECSGRVMVLFRALARNTEEGAIPWLKNQLHLALGALDPNFQSGMVGTTIVPVRYLPLPEENGEQLGAELMISFWAWGNSEDENMQNLGRLLKNLSQALRRVSALCVA